MTERADLVPATGAPSTRQTPVYSVFRTDCWEERRKIYRTIGPTLRSLCAATQKHGFAFGFMSDLILYSFCDPVVMARNCSARYLALSLTPYLENCEPAACYPLIILLDSLVSSERVIARGLPGFDQLDQITRYNLTEFEDLCHFFLGHRTVENAQLAVRILHHMARATTNYTWFSSHFKYILYILAESSTPVQISLAKSIYNLAKAERPMVYDRMYLDIMAQLSRCEDDSVRGFAEQYFEIVNRVLGDAVQLREEQWDDREGMEEVGGWREIQGTRWKEVEGGGRRWNEADGES